ncbi:hypothetical protein PsYK624_172640 [Phanerochaete sordida]|uniref:Uncharacterized protein n=1 Tax=Phanerochaete sordida TaxID=48140 RepID=A0A9P3LPE6_9APHY|nr:hypothetical protein PsYK624_172640 [Phanerochaete sordida]
MLQLRTDTAPYPAELSSWSGFEFGVSGIAGSITITFNTDAYTWSDGQEFLELIRRLETCFMCMEHVSCESTSGLLVDFGIHLRKSAVPLVNSIALRNREEKSLEPISRFMLNNEKPISVTMQTADLVRLNYGCQTNDNIVNSVLW